MIDYAKVLRSAGLEVVEYPGWRERTSAGSFRPRAVMVHHDASSPGPSPALEGYIAEGSNISPLANLWVDYSGRWHVLAYGNANHAGRGRGFGPVPRGAGNIYAVGVETDFTTGEDLRAGWFESVCRGSAALADYLGCGADGVVGHKEYAPSRKVDPDWDMDRMRGRVAEILSEGEALIVNKSDEDAIRRIFREELGTRGADQAEPGDTGAPDGFPKTRWGSAYAAVTDYLDGIFRKVGEIHEEVVGE